MEIFKEYDQYDGLGLAELIHKGDVTAQEVCDTAMGRIEQLNPKLNAVVTNMFDEARLTLAGPLPDGPFKGVPFLLKDLLAAYAGVPLTGGSKAFRNYVPDHDSEMVKRFKKAGLVIMGKTNTPEFGLVGYTEPELHGPTRNPWNPDHTPGGSSGGSASAVAARMMPLASGGDGGGSIRIPSACCGLFGLKPSRGRNPLGPDHGQVWQGAVQEHVLTLSVRDSAAMLDCTQGSDPGAPYVIAPPTRPYLEEVGCDPGRLKIAFTTQSPLGTKVHPECITAVKESARLLESLGHQIEEDQPRLDGLALAKSYLVMYFGELAADINEMRLTLGRRPQPSDVEPLTWTLALLGRAVSAGEFVSAIRLWDAAAREMGRFFQTYDLYLTPTLAYPPARIGELKPKPSELTLMKVVNALGLGGLLKATGMPDKLAKPSFEKTPFTQLANLCGLPAMSVPLHWTQDNLPCGSQFVAPFGGEDVLFRLAAQLEQARPWFQRKPPLASA